MVQSQGCIATPLCDELGEFATALLFFVLIAIKHRLPPVLDRFMREAS